MISPSIPLHQIIPDTRYQIPDIRYQIPDTSTYLIPDFCFSIFTTIVHSTLRTHGRLLVLW